MAQTAQTEPTPTPSDQPSGGIGNATTILLLVAVAVIFWWSMRRRQAFEERIRAQRRQETLAAAERSAQDVARIMREPTPPGAAAAAASEGLASAARTPVPPAPRAEAPQVGAADGTVDAAAAEAQAAGEAGGYNSVEAALAAERAAVTDTRSEIRESELAGDVTARQEAVSRAAEEARTEPAEGLGASPGEAHGASQPEPEETAALRAALRELDQEAEVPFGAVPGDGSPSCPPEYPIKANAQSGIYHEPGQSSYPPTIPEFCFASAEAAEAAGFRHSRARGHRPRE
jgi:hypothetical protein